jgi:hypothetical protein
MLNCYHRLLSINVCFCPLLSSRAPPLLNRYYRLLWINVRFCWLLSRAPPQLNCWIDYYRLMSICRLLSSPAPPRRAVTSDYYRWNDKFVLCPVQYFTKSAVPKRTTRWSDTFFYDDPPLPQIHFLFIYLFVYRELTSSGHELLVPAFKASAQDSARCFPRPTLQSVNQPFMWRELLNCIYCPPGTGEFWSLRPTKIH